MQNVFESHRFHDQPFGHDEISQVEHERVLERLVSDMIAFGISLDEVDAQLCRDAAGRAPQQTQSRRHARAD